MISPQLRRGYVHALGRHVAAGDEATLREGYELGRRAVTEGCSALELAAIHHDALAASLRGGSEVPPADVVSAAATFFQESLSAFEMLHRGFEEAASAAAAERQAAAMLRRLSSFLADASLSARESDAGAEVLHLVAEHARELTNATYATASWSAGADDVRARSIEPEAADDRADVLARLEQAGAALPARVTRADWPGTAALRGTPPSNLLAVPLVALDGRHVGRLQLIEKREGEFTDVDEAVAIHLADMAAAALERAQLYSAS